MNTRNKETNSIIGLPTLLIGVLILVSPGSAIGMEKGIGGSYQGEIWSGDYPRPGSTRFSRNSANNIIGSYRFEENNELISGQLHDCIKKELKLTCTKANMG